MKTDIIIYAFGLVIFNLSTVSLQAQFNYVVTNDKLGENHPGQARQETKEAKADRLGQEHLRLLGWTESDLATRRSRDPSKLAIAARQRAETTLLMKRTAERLHLGKPKGAKTNLHKRVNGVRENDPQPTLGI